MTVEIEWYVGFGILEKEPGACPWLRGLVLDDAYKPVIGGDYLLCGVDASQRLFVLRNWSKLDPGQGSRLLAHPKGIEEILLRGEIADAMLALARRQHGVARAEYWDLLGEVKMSYFAVCRGMAAPLRTL